LLLNIGGHEWLRVLLAGIAVYLLLLPLWWQAINPVAALVTTIANWIYGIFDQQVMITAKNGIGEIRVYTNGRSKVYSSELQIDAVTSGLPLLLALLFVTRADSLYAKARLLSVALLITAFATVTAVILTAKEASMKITEVVQGGGGHYSRYFYNAVDGYSICQPVLAVTIWIALLMFGSFKKTRTKQEVGHTKRNAPCPCGSLQKYKRCCGKS